LQLARSLAVLISPVMPNIAKDIFELLNVTDTYTGEANLDDTQKENRWLSAIKPILIEGAVLNEPKILFDRIEDEFVEAQQAKLGQNQEKPAKENPKYDEITIEDFAKVKLCTAKVLEAEKVKKSKKLIKMQVDLGWEKRQILAGVAEHYKPEDLIGKTIVVVANLKPAKLMGLESQGMMLCAASSEDGKLIFISPTDEIGEGEEVR
jgi:methionyl-tRNA synthetase